MVIAHPIQAVHPSLALYAVTYSASVCVPRPQEKVSPDRHPHLLTHTYVMPQGQRWGRRA